MSGIVGVFNLEKDRLSENITRSMLEVMSFRGKTIRCKTDKNISFGYCGSPTEYQPLCGDDGSMVIFNGQVYNQSELRGLLLKNGVLLRGNSVCELLLNLYQQYGVEFVGKLNGMFALAIWDAGKSVLHLSRDRFGIIPLYWSIRDNTFLFASEIKAILKHPKVSPRLNYNALNEYFTFQNLFRYHTLFQGINLLQQASTRSIKEGDPYLSRTTYWDYDFTHRDAKMRRQEAKKETIRLLEQAIERQLQDDKEIGILLSGGIDSSSILAIAADTVKRLYTFTIGFHMDSVEGVEANYDERQYAELMANYFKTEHYEQVISSGDMNWVLPDVVYHLEDLRAGQCYSNYYVTRLAAKFTSVVLIGGGGDELYGGYPWRYYRVFNSVNQEEFIKKYYDFWQRLVPDEDKPKLFTKQTWNKTERKDTFEIFRRVLTFNEELQYETPEDHIANAMYFEIKTFLPGLFIVENKLAGAQGLEERPCFMDNDLAEFAQKIPIRYKLKRLKNMKQLDENLLRKKQKYYQEYSGGKNILREAMADFIPKKILVRTKQGFSSPDASWYRGENVNYIKKILLNPNAAYAEFISRDYVERIITEHCERKINHRLLIWSFLNFEWWCRIFLEDRYPV